MNSTPIRPLVLRGLEKHPLFAAFTEAAGGGDRRALYSELYERGAENDLLKALCTLVLLDDNAFSRTCAKGDTPSAYLYDAFADDLDCIFGGAAQLENDERFNLGSAIPPFDGGLDGRRSADNLVQFYAAHGYGDFIVRKAFTFDGGRLVPVANVSSVTVDDLKDYAEEKRQIDDNICNFIAGLPYANMLLYGDRGTGKSSTVHAMLNKHFDDGLRIIELSKENILSVPKIRELVAENPLKFIVFIDDLSLGEYDDKVSSLKAALEGSVSGGTDNIMIVATSNRRHIVKESFSDRENSVHPGDSIAEQLSLSDRFGLTVLFYSTDNDMYLSIVSQLADDRKLLTDRQKLAALAERWALVKGGRSPRRAKQFIDFVYAAERRGANIEF